MKNTIMLGLLNSQLDTAKDEAKRKQDMMFDMKKKNEVLEGKLEEAHQKILTVEDQYDQLVKEKSVQADQLMREMEMQKQRVDQLTATNNRLNEDLDQTKTDFLQTQTESERYPSLPLAAQPSHPAAPAISSSCGMLLVPKSSGYKPPPTWGSEVLNKRRLADEGRRKSPSPQVSVKPAVTVPIAHGSALPGTSGRGPGPPPPKPTSAQTPPGLEVHGRVDHAVRNQRVSPPKGRSSKIGSHTPRVANT